MHSFLHHRQMDRSKVTDSWQSVNLLVLISYIVVFILCSYVAFIASRVFMYVWRAPCICCSFSSHKSPNRIAPLGFEKEERIYIIYIYIYIYNHTAEA